MGAPVASGTLAGSRSGSWASIHKQAAGGDFSRFRRHPGSHDSHYSLGPSRSPTSSLGTISATARGSRSRSALPAVRDSSVREARRREPAVVCQQPSVVRSPQFGDRRRSRPRGRRDYREPWQRHSEARAAARVEAVVPRPARARLDAGDSHSAPSLLGGRFRASRITCYMGTGRTEGPLRPRSNGCHSGRRSGHLVPAGTRAAPHRPDRQRGRRRRGWPLVHASESRARLQVVADQPAASTPATPAIAA